MKTRSLKSLIFIALISVHVQVLNSQAGLYSGFDTLSLDEVAITATKTYRNPKEVPGKISILKSDIIKSSPAMQIDDILRYMPSVNVNRSLGIYSQRPMVTLRGLSGDEQSRTLVLLNGVPINTSDEGGVNWNRINQFDVERIEIFKGPGSSLYGNNAMGGVINIITKKPKKAQEVFSAISYGTFNTIRQDLNIGMKSEKGLYASISEYFLKSDGYNNIPEEKRTEYDIASYLEEMGMSTKIGHDANKWLTWELQYDIFRDKRGEGTRIYAPDGCYRNFNTNLVRGSLNGGDNRKIRYNINAYYQLERYYDINENFRRGAYSRYDVLSFRKDMGLLLTLNRDLFENNTLTGGFELKKGSISGGDYYQTVPYDTVYNAGISGTFALYLQDEYSFFEKKISIVAGARYDQVSFRDGDFYSTDPWNDTPELKNHTWSEISPRIGVRFNFIEEVSSYISYSHGFRASILDDLTRSGWMWVGPKYANPELGPESMNNYEIGIDLNPNKKFELSVSGYYSLGKDFLYYVATGDYLYGTLPIYIRKNISEVTVKGIETELKWNVLDGFDIISNYTFNDAKIINFKERPELEGKNLTYSPKHSVSSSIIWNNKVLNTSLKCLYKSKQYGDDANENILDGYFTIDLMLSKPIKDHLIISLDIEDMLNNRHMATINYISPGRLINGRIAFQF